MEFSEIKKQIIAVLADGKFHSGTELADKLRISRSAVWKQLHGLNDLGLPIIAVSGKGYKIPYPLQLLSEASIIANLSLHTKGLLKSMHIFNTLDSSNAFLVDQARQGAESGTVCMTEYQSAGRGRRGRQWQSPYGGNIYFSILWRYPCGPAQISALSLVAGLAVIRALQYVGISDVGLKWPNDIYWRQKKLGGILVEVAGEFDGPCSVVIGLGLNLLMPEMSGNKIDREWVDLKTLLQEKPLPDRNELLAQLLNEYFAVLDGFDKHGLKPYLQEWQQHDCMQGQEAILMLGNRQISGTVQGIDEHGMLIMQMLDGVCEVFSSGEVTFNCRE